MRNAWYIAKLSHELSPNKPVATTVLGAPLVLFRGPGGRPACLLDACPHRVVPLSLGKVCDGKLQCAYHAWQYDTTGRCVHVPALPPGQEVPKNARAHALPTVERAGAIWVWPGQPELADERLIPLPSEQAPGMAGMAHAHTMTWLFPVRYNLLMEHVLDLPHFYNLHASSVLRLIRQRASDIPVARDLEDRGDELTMDVHTREGHKPMRLCVFHPCHLRFEASVTDELSYRLFFIHTPVDERRTQGYMFQYRNFLTGPLHRKGFNWLFTHLTHKAIAEDGLLFRGQMENIALHGKSYTSYYYDGVLAKYQKWQGRREPEDLFFRGFEEERARYQKDSSQGAVRLPIAITNCREA